MSGEPHSAGGAIGGVWGAKPHEQRGGAGGRRPDEDDGRGGGRDGRRQDGRQCRHQARDAKAKNDAIKYIKDHRAPATLGWKIILRGNAEIKDLFCKKTIFVMFVYEAFCILIEFHMSFIKTEFIY